MRVGRYEAGHEELPGSAKAMISRRAAGANLVYRVISDHNFVVAEETKLLVVSGKDPIRLDDQHPACAPWPRDERRRQADVCVTSRRSLLRDAHEHKHRPVCGARPG